MLQLFKPEDFRTSFVQPTGIVPLEPGPVVDTEGLACEPNRTKNPSPSDFQGVMKVQAGRQRKC